MPTLDKDCEQDSEAWFEPVCNDNSQDIHGAWNDRHTALLELGHWRSLSRPNRPVQTPLDAEQSEADELYRLVSYHVAKWKDETANLSSIAKMVLHPSYLRLIALGGRSPNVVGILLRELRSEPDYWFEALKAITGEDAATADSDLDESVRLWLEWGTVRGIV